MVDSTTGNIAYCLNESAYEQPVPACVPSTGCDPEDAIPVNGSTGTTCSEDFSNGASCVASCPANTSAVGEFLCRSGNVFGSSVCSTGGDGINAKSQTVVGGTISVTASTNQSVDALASSAQTGIADALKVNKEDVKMDITLRSANGAARRLRGNLQVDLRYEVIVSGGMSVSVLAKAAKNLTEDGSAEYKQFIATMADQSINVDTVTMVAAPVALVVLIPTQSSGQPLQRPPTVRTVVITTTTTSRTDDDDPTDVIVGVVIAVIVFIAITVGCAFFISRKGGCTGKTGEQGPPVRSV